MSDAQLKKLCADWRKSAKWWRGKGFYLHSITAVESRRGMAKVFEQCADDLSAQLKKAKK